MKLATIKIKCAPDMGVVSPSRPAHEILRLLLQHCWGTMNTTDAIVLQELRVCILHLQHMMTPTALSSAMMLTAGIPNFLRNMQNTSRRVRLASHVSSAADAAQVLMATLFPLPTSGGTPSIPSTLALDIMHAIMMDVVFMLHTDRDGYVPAKQGVALDRASYLPARAGEAVDMLSDMLFHAVVMPLNDLKPSEDFTLNIPEVARVGAAIQRNLTDLAAIANDISRAQRTDVFRALTFLWHDSAGATANATASAYLLSNNGGPLWGQANILDPQYADNPMLQWTTDERVTNLEAVTYGGKNVSDLIRSFGLIYRTVTVSEALSRYTRHTYNIAGLQEQGKEVPVCTIIYRPSFGGSMAKGIFGHIDHLSAGSGLPTRTQFGNTPIMFKRDGVALPPFVEGRPDVIWDDIGASLAHSITNAYDLYAGRQDRQRDAVTTLEEPELALLAALVSSDVFFDSSSGQFVTVSGAMPDLVYHVQGEQYLRHRSSLPGFAPLPYGIATKDVTTVLALALPNGRSTASFRMNDRMTKLGLTEVADAITTGSTAFAFPQSFGWPVLRTLAGLMPNETYLFSPINITYPEVFVSYVGVTMALNITKQAQASSTLRNVQLEPGSESLIGESDLPSGVFLGSGVTATRAEAAFAMAVFRSYVGNPTAGDLTTIGLVGVIHSGSVIGNQNDRYNQCVMQRGIELAGQLGIRAARATLERAVARYNAANPTAPLNPTYLPSGLFADELAVSALSLLIGAIDRETYSPDVRNIALEYVAPTAGSGVADQLRMIFKTNYVGSLFSKSGKV